MALPRFVEMTFINGIAFKAPLVQLCMRMAEFMMEDDTFFADNYGIMSLYRDVAAQYAKNRENFEEAISEFLFTELSYAELRAFLIPFGNADQDDVLESIDEYGDEPSCWAVSFTGDDE